MQQIWKPILNLLNWFVLHGHNHLAEWVSGVGWVGGEGAKERETNNRMIVEWK